MTPEQTRNLAKVQKCLNLAADVRGDPTTRETAWRQAQALIAKHGLQLEQFEAAEPAPSAPVVPAVASPEWAPYWARRTTAEAMAAQVRTNVLCRDGWFIPA